MKNKGGEQIVNKSYSVGIIITQMNGVQKTKDVGERPEYEINVIPKECECEGGNITSIVLRLSNFQL